MSFPGVRLLNSASRKQFLGRLGPKEDRALLESTSIRKLGIVEPVIRHIEQVEIVLLRKRATIALKPATPHQKNDDPPAPNS
jgi:hypothetical protein